MEVCLLGLNSSGSNPGIRAFQSACRHHRRAGFEGPLPLWYCNDLPTRRLLSPKGILAILGLRQKSFRTTSTLSLGMTDPGAAN